MFHAKDNTVSAEHQIRHSSEIGFLGKENAPLKILILGNSITRHGPKPEIGREHDFGMAASAEERDYVHRLFALLSERGLDVRFYIRQASYWEVHFRDEDVLSHFVGEREFSPDLILFRLGENAASHVANEAESREFEEKLRDFIAYLNPHGCPVVYTTGFWRSALVDDAIVRVSAGVGTVVDLNFLGRADKNMAIGKFSHRGVAHHPGDLGMERIARLLAPVIEALVT